jgi:hypothetical protein
VENIKKNNKVLRFLLGFLVLLLLTNITGATDTSSVFWNKIYGGNKYDTFLDLTLHPNGGYLCVGSITSLGPKNQNMWVTHILENGSVAWSKAYGGDGEDFAQAVIQTSDSGFLILGSTTSFDTAEDYDFLLMKINVTGDVVWFKTFGGLFDDFGTALIQTTDDYSYITGITTTSQNDTDCLLIKINHEGDIKWSQTFGGEGNEECWDLTVTPHRDILLVGSTSSFGHGEEDIWLVKTDSFGTELWNRTYGGTKSDKGLDLMYLPDSTMVISGETASFGSGSYDMWVLKTDDQGTLLWNRTIGGKDEDSGQALLQTNDGEIVVAGFSEAGLYYGCSLVYLTCDGFLTNHTVFQFGTDEKAYALTQSSNRSLVLAGFSQTKNGYDALLVKLNQTDAFNENRYPIAMAGKDVEVNVGEEILLNGSGYDPDNDSIFYQWDVNNNGIYDFESNITGSTTYVFKEAGTYNAILKLTDSHGSSTTDMCTIVVHETNTTACDNLLFMSLFLFGVLILFAYYIVTKESVKGKLKKICHRYFPFLENIDKWTSYLILTFLLITGIKIVFSFLFTTPMIYPDEQIYGVMAHNIVQGDVSFMGHVPWIKGPIAAGYSYFLAPAYLLGDNMEIVYHGMLVINCILTSFLMFPVFYIMRSFVSKKVSFFTSLIVACLPAVLSYNYVLMTENAFYLLFLISCLFTIKVFTYNTFDKRFIFYSLILCFSIGSLLIIKPTGISMLAALFFVFIYKLCKYKKQSLKYSLVFFPLLIFGLYLLLRGKTNVVGYSQLSQHLDRFFLVFTDISSLTRFISIMLNQISYIIPMSYVILIVFTIFLFIHFRKFPDEKKEPLMILSLYGLFSIFFLIVISTYFIFWFDVGGFSVISRYMSPGLFIIVMLGIIGINLFKNIKHHMKSTQIIIMFILMFMFLILIFPVEFFETVSNIDLIWVMSLKNLSISGVNGVKILQIFLATVSIILVYLLIFKWFFHKSIKFPVKRLRLVHFMPVIIILSLLLFSISASHILDEHRIAISSGYNEPARWLMQNDPDAILVMEDSYGAFSGGGMYPLHWDYLYIDMNFWFPKGQVYVWNKDNINMFLSSEIDADYIISTHDLTEYYKSVQDFYIDIEPLKRQDKVDWHIYRLQE